MNQDDPAKICREKVINNLAENRIRNLNTVSSTNNINNIRYGVKSEHKHNQLTS